MGNATGIVLYVLCRWIRGLWGFKVYIPLSTNISPNSMGKKKKKVIAIFRCYIFLLSFRIISDILESQQSSSNTTAFRWAAPVWPAQRLEVPCSLLNPFFPLTLKAVNIIHHNGVAATWKLILDGDQGHAFARGKSVLQLKILGH